MQSAITDVSISKIMSLYSKQMQPISDGVLSLYLERFQELEFRSAPIELVLLAYLYIDPPALQDC